MNFKDIPIYNIGNTIQLVGAVFQGDGETYAFMLPGETMAFNPHTNFGLMTPIEMSPEDWKACLRQSDLCETEIFDGDKKAIVRKCERLVDATLSWGVFKRDSFSCRYCGAEDKPLTVDHLILWEEGGPTIKENLLSSCKKCNRTRGRMQYADWLKSDYYQMVSVKSSYKVANEALVKTLPLIQRVKHIRSR